MTKTNKSAVEALKIESPAIETTGFEKIETIQDRIDQAKAVIIPDLQGLIKKHESKKPIITNFQRTYYEESFPDNEGRQLRGPRRQKITEDINGGVSAYNKELEKWEKKNTKLLSILNKVQIALEDISGENLELLIEAINEANEYLGFGVQPEVEKKTAPASTPQIETKEKPNLDEKTKLNGLGGLFSINDNGLYFEDFPTAIFDFTGNVRPEITIQKLETKDKKLEYFIHVYPTDSSPGHNYIHPIFLNSDKKEITFERLHKPSARVVWQLNTPYVVSKDATWEKLQKFYGEKAPKVEESEKVEKKSPSLAPNPDSEQAKIIVELLETSLEYIQRLGSNIDSRDKVFLQLLSTISDNFPKINLKLFDSIKKGIPASEELVKQDAVAVESSDLRPETKELLTKILNNLASVYQKLAAQAENPDSSNLENKGSLQPPSVQTTDTQTPESGLVDQPVDKETEALKTSGTATNSVVEPATTKDTDTNTVLTPAPTEPQPLPSPESPESPRQIGSNPLPDYLKLNNNDAYISLNGFDIILPIGSVTKYGVKDNFPYFISDKRNQVILRNRSENQADFEVKKGNEIIGYINVGIDKNSFGFVRISASNGNLLEQTDYVGGQIVQSEQQSSIQSGKINIAELSKLTGEAKVSSFISQSITLIQYLEKDPREENSRDIQKLKEGISKVSEKRSIREKELTNLREIAEKHQLLEQLPEGFSANIPSNLKIENASLKLAKQNFEILPLNEQEITGFMNDSEGDILVWNNGNQYQIKTNADPESKSTEYTVLNSNNEEIKKFKIDIDENISYQKNGVTYYWANNEELNQEGFEKYLTFNENLKIANIKKSQENATIDFKVDDISFTLDSNIEQTIKSLSSASNVEEMQKIVYKEYISNNKTNSNLFSDPGYELLFTLFNQEGKVKTLESIINHPEKYLKPETNIAKVVQAYAKLDKNSLKSLLLSELDYIENIATTREANASESFAESLQSEFGINYDLETKKLTFGDTNSPKILFLEDINEKILLQRGSKNMERSLEEWLQFNTKIMSSLSSDEAKNNKKAEVLKKLDQYSSDVQNKTDQIQNEASKLESRILPTLFIQDTEGITFELPEVVKIISNTVTLKLTNDEVKNTVKLDFESEIGQKLLSFIDSKKTEIDQLLEEIKNPETSLSSKTTNLEKLREILAELSEKSLLAKAKTDYPEKMAQFEDQAFYEMKIFKEKYDRSKDKILSLQKTESSSTYNNLINEVSEIYAEKHQIPSDGLYIVAIGNLRSAFANNDELKRFTDEKISEAQNEIVSLTFDDSGDFTDLNEAKTKLAKIEEIFESLNPKNEGSKISGIIAKTDLTDFESIKSKTDKFYSDLEESNKTYTNTSIKISDDKISVVVSGQPFSLELTYPVARKLLYKEDFNSLKILNERNMIFSLLYDKYKDSKKILSNISALRAFNYMATACNKSEISNSNALVDVLASN